MNFPEIPDSAPFTAEQRQWLNGYIKDLISTLQGGAAGVAAPAAAARQPVMVLFGSQSGNAEGLAEGFAQELSGQQIPARAVNMEEADPAALKEEEAVLVVTSTWGEGDPPDTAVEFWNKISGDDQPKLEGVNFSVLALGDTNYADFCEFGKLMDGRLGDLGGNRIADRVDCDVDFDDPSREWFGAVTTALKALAPAATNGAVSAAPAVAPAKKIEDIPFGKKRPFPSKVLVNNRLNKPESPRDTRHYELSLDGSGLSYEVGDALAVVPENDPAMVDEIIGALPFKTDVQYESRGGEMAPLRDILLKDYDLRVVNKKIVTEWAQRSHHPYLRSIVDSGKSEEIDNFIWGREIVDLVVDFPAEFKNADEFIKLLRKLGPRLYSIASSPNAHPGEVHLTVATVMYETHGRKRGGVCST
ncbi:MAG: sulfite reductase flavoprotein subunit alpha, partial [Verrucomicrobiota bacterium]